MTRLDRWRVRSPDDASAAVVLNTMLRKRLGAAGSPRPDPSAFHLFQLFAASFVNELLHQERS